VTTLSPKITIFQKLQNWECLKEAEKL